MTESLACIQANEREIAELREQLISVTNYSRWLANIVSRLSQRIEVIENVSHISKPPQRNTETRYLGKKEWRVV